MQSPLPGYAPVGSEGPPPPPSEEGPRPGGTAAEAEAAAAAAAQPGALPLVQQVESGSSGAQQSLAAKFEAADAGQRRVGSEVWGAAAAEAAEEPPFHQQDGWEGEPLSPVASPSAVQQQQPAGEGDGDEPPFHQDDSWAGEPLSPASAAAARGAQPPRQPSGALLEEPVGHQEDSWSGEALSPSSRAAALQQEQRQAEEEPPAHQRDGWAGEALAAEGAARAAAAAANPASAEAVPGAELAGAAVAAGVAEGWGDLDEEPWEALVEEQDGQDPTAAAAPAADGEFVAAGAAGRLTTGAVKPSEGNGVAAAAEAAAEGLPAEAEGWGGGGFADEQLPAPEDAAAVAAEESQLPSRDQQWQERQPHVLSAAVDAAAPLAVEPAGLGEDVGEPALLQQQVAALYTQCQQQQALLQQGAAASAVREEQLASLHAQLEQHAAAALASEQQIAALQAQLEAQAAANLVAAEGEQKHLVGAASEQEALEQVSAPASGQLGRMLVSTLQHCMGSVALLRSCLHLRPCLHSIDVCPSCTSMQALAARDAALEQKESVASGLETQLAQRDVELAQRDAELAQLRERLAASEAHAHELQSGSAAAEATTLEAQASMATLQVRGWGPELPGRMVTVALNREFHGCPSAQPV